MSHEHVCPWWIGHLLACPIRRLWHNPDKIIGPFVKSGMRILEIGPGMGFFTLPMAELAGPQGKVFAIDIQEKMLRVLRKRAQRSGFADRIECRLTTEETTGIGDLVESIDFTLLIAVVHEVPDKRRLFNEIRHAMKTGGIVLMADPRSHFSRDEFDQALEIALETGFVRERNPAPHIKGFNSALLRAA